MTVSTRSRRSSLVQFAPLEARTLAAADLSISSIDCPAVVQDWGKNYDFTVKIRNNGDKAVAPGARVQFALSRDDKWGNDDDSDLMSSYVTDQTIKPKKLITVKLSRRAPGINTGLWRVAARVDPFNNIAESNEANNYGFGQKDAVSLFVDATFNKEWMQGTDENDVMTIRKQKDHCLVQVKNKFDRVYGTTWNDMPTTFYGGKGNDKITIDKSVDVGLTLEGNEGNDVLTGGVGDDTINGGSGKDLLVSGGGKNRMHGNGGNDRFQCKNSIRDFIFGDAGKDTADADANDRKKTM